MAVYDQLNTVNIASRRCFKPQRYRFDMKSKNKALNTPREI